MAQTKALNLKRITDILKEHKEELKEKYEVKEIGIFGSYVREECKEKSDLDILVEFEEDAKIGLLKFVNMENYLLEVNTLFIERGNPWERRICGTIDGGRSNSLSL